MNERVENTPLPNWLRPVFRQSDWQPAHITNNQIGTGLFDAELCYSQIGMDRVFAARLVCAVGVWL